MTPSSTKDELKALAKKNKELATKNKEKGIPEYDFGKASLEALHRLKDEE
jgi:hypothetical protein